MYPVTIRDEPARRVVGLAHVGPYHAIGPVFDRLGAVLGAAGLWPRVAGVLTIACSDPDTTPAAELQSFAGALLDPAVPCPAGLEERSLAGGRHAVLALTGPYEGLRDAWGWLYGPWMAATGEAPAPAPCFEVYRNSPADTPPEALRTDLFVPLA